MAFIWTDSMGALAHNPELEQETRFAVATACFVWSSLPPNQRPVFSGSAFVIAKNDAAKTLVEACMKDVKTENGIARQTILTTAVRAAEHFVRRGADEKAWASLADLVKAGKT